MTHWIQKTRNVIVMMENVGCDCNDDDECDCDDDDECDCDDDDDDDGCRMSL